VLYPAHPASVAHLREALHPSGAKDDPTDADLLMDLLLHHRAQLHCWKPDTEETRTLQFLVEDRRKLVDENWIGSRLCGNGWPSTTTSAPILRSSPHVSSTSSRRGVTAAGV
jgi:Transposase